MARGPLVTEKEAKQICWDFRMNKHTIRTIATTTGRSQTTIRRILREDPKCAPLLKESSCSSST